MKNTLLAAVAVATSFAFVAPAFAGESGQSALAQIDLVPRPGSSSIGAGIAIHEDDEDNIGMAVKYGYGLTDVTSVSVGVFTDEDDNTGIAAAIVFNF